MSFAKRILIGLVSGAVGGLLLGELVAPLKVAKDGFVKLPQMTVPFNFVDLYIPSNPFYSLAYTLFRPLRSSP